MNWSQLFQLTVDGLTLGCVYALIALGYTMVYGILRLINFAHGDVYMLGAFFGYFTAPNRQVIEYTAEVEQIPPGEDRPARMWLPEEISVHDPWAAHDSARPTAHARELMLGGPEDTDQRPGGQQ